MIKITNTDVFLRLRKLVGIKSNVRGRLLDGGDWVTNGFLLIRKNLEPRKWKQRRYEGTLEPEKVQIITSKFNDSTTYEKLDLDHKIDLRWPTDLLLIGPTNRTWVDIEFLLLLTDIYIWGRTRLLNFSDTHFLQEQGKPTSEIFIVDKNQQLIGVLMPKKNYQAEEAGEG